MPSWKLDQIKLHTDEYDDELNHMSASQESRVHKMFVFQTGRERSSSLRHVSIYTYQQILKGPYSAINAFLVLFSAVKRPKNIT